jgi:hypothetical protein
MTVIHRKDEPPEKGAHHTKKDEEATAAARVGHDAGQPGESESASVGRPAFGAPSGEDMAELKRREMENLKAQMVAPVPIPVIVKKEEDVEKEKEKAKAKWERGKPKKASARDADRTAPGGGKTFLVAARHSTCPEPAWRVEAADHDHAERQFLSLYGGEVYAVEELDDDDKADDSKEKAKNK